MDGPVPLTRIMSVLRELTDQAPTGGYHDLYKAVLDGRLRTQRRGREYDVRSDRRHNPH
jgi:hypothetical protein